MGFCFFVFAGPALVAAKISLSLSISVPGIHLAILQNSMMVRLSKYNLEVYYMLMFNQCIIHFIYEG